MAIVNGLIIRNLNLNKLTTMKKQTKSKRCNLLLTPGMVKLVDEIAVKEKRSRNTMVEMFIEKGIEDYAKEHIES